MFDTKYWEKLLQKAVVKPRQDLPHANNVSVIRHLRS
jgi:hypothetical protein